LYFTLYLWEFCLHFLNLGTVSQLVSKLFWANQSLRTYPWKAKFGHFQTWSCLQTFCICFRSYWLASLLLFVLDSYFSWSSLPDIWWVKISESFVLQLIDQVSKQNAYQRNDENAKVKKHYAKFINSILALIAQE